MGRRKSSAAKAQIPSKRPDGDAVQRLEALRQEFSGTSESGVPAKVENNPPTDYSADVSSVNALARLEEDVRTIVLKHFADEAAAAAAACARELSETFREHVQSGDAGSEASPGEHKALGREEWAAEMKKARTDPTRRNPAQLIRDLFGREISAGTLKRGDLDLRLSQAYASHVSHSRHPEDAIWPTKPKRKCLNEEQRRAEDARRQAVRRQILRQS